MKLVEKMAEQAADNALDCICDPEHPFDDTGTCFFHLEVGDQFQYAYEAGFRAAKEMAVGACENRHVNHSDYTPRAIMKDILILGEQEV